MSTDLTQLLFYAGFAVLGWWLRHLGFLGPKAGPVLPSGPIDQRAIVDLLKALLDRLAHPPITAPAPAGTVITVPFEVAATPRPPAPSA